MSFSHGKGFLILETVERGKLQEGTNSYKCSFSNLTRPRLRTVDSVDTTAPRVLTVARLIEHNRAFPGRATA